MYEEDIFALQCFHIRQICRLSTLLDSRWSILNTVVYFQNWGKRVTHRNNPWTNSQSNLVLSNPEYLLEREKDKLPEQNRVLACLHKWTKCNLEWCLPCLRPRDGHASTLYNTHNVLKPSFVVLILAWYFGLSIVMQAWEPYKMKWKRLTNLLLKSSCNYGILLDFKKIIPLNCWSQMWKIVVKDPQMKCADLSCNCMSWLCLLTNLIKVKRLESKDYSSAIWYQKIELIQYQLALRVSVIFNF